METEKGSRSMYRMPRLPHSQKDVQQMLEVVGVSSEEELVSRVLPEGLHPLIRSQWSLPSAMEEWEVLKIAEERAQENIPGTPWIGLGYARSRMPEIIRRMVWENPGWYTQYTPYQAEISQGRMEALLIFQTLVEDLTGMDIANASLLDEASSAAEALMMMLRIRRQVHRKEPFRRILLLEPIYPNLRAVLEGKAWAVDVELSSLWLDEVLSEPTRFQKEFARADGVILQVPDGYGRLHTSLPEVLKAIREQGALITVLMDPIGGLLVGPPGKWGADIVVGSLQRFGLPLGLGGPHPGFLATRREFIRQIPGRLMGVSRDHRGNIAFRMTLQTREQHIRRERATSNICTSQSLPAIISAFYAMYHGEEGLRLLAENIHRKACVLADHLKSLGFSLVSEQFIDTVGIILPDERTAEKLQKFLAENYNHWVRWDKGTRYVFFTVDEVTSEEEIRILLQGVCEFTGHSSRNEFQKSILLGSNGSPSFRIPENLRRSPGGFHPVFSAHRGELRMMRWIRYLEKKDLSMAESMIPLGSCTMKMNLTSALVPLSWKAFADLHPWAPEFSRKGMEKILDELKTFLCEITGMDAFTLMPASGAMGELVGLLIIKRWLEKQKELKRDVILVPASAHGTNPASAVQAGFQPVVVPVTSRGEMDLQALKQLLHQYEGRVAGIMITYPSTHGVFEDTILPVVEAVHQAGGLVYLDGANLNAMLGIVRPGDLGVDICHVNLHKTFDIPHGGGGPGAGPVGVKKFLEPFLPQDPLSYSPDASGIPPVHGAPVGNGYIQIISWAYIRWLGREGIAQVGKRAILTANYVMRRLEQDFPVLYRGEKGYVAHEFILDLRPWKQKLQLDAMDIAKRLIDYSIHAPTVSFPVYNTLMIEPTESEPLEELERFIRAMKQIRRELQKIQDGEWDRRDNPLRNAPHSLEEATANEWNHSYSREEACYPLPDLRRRKFWAPVSRIDDAWGDRHPICRYPEQKEFFTMGGEPASDPRLHSHPLSSPVSP